MSTTDDSGLSAEDFINRAGYLVLESRYINDFPEKIFRSGQCLDLTWIPSTPEQLSCDNGIALMGQHIPTIDGPQDGTHVNMSHPKLKMHLPDLAKKGKDWILKWYADRVVFWFTKTTVYSPGDETNGWASEMNDVKFYEEDDLVTICPRPGAKA